MRVLFATRIEDVKMGSDALREGLERCAWLLEEEDAAGNAWCDAAHMSVRGRHLAGVADADIAAIGAPPPRLFDDPVTSGINRRAGRHGEIYAFVHTGEPQDRMAAHSLSH